jgi:hypothetical protein
MMKFGIVVTKSFIVKSTVQHRYAITEVKTVISNPETTGQQVFNFGFVIPREAFISKVQIDRFVKIFQTHSSVMSHAMHALYKAEIVTKLIFISNHSFI